MSSSVGNVYMDVLFDIPKMSRDLTASTTQASATAATAMTKTFEQRLTSFGSTLSNIGKKWSLYLSAPLAGVGFLSVKAFSGFEAEMAKIEGLVGASREQITAWSADARKAGTDFGVGAQAAAEGLYFVASSGIKGSQAIDVLNVSAKASAVGLGETKTVADLVTSALNAYAGTGLTAARSTDVLVAAVRDGKSEPEELASSMGRVLPIAANLGVTFDQVAGAMASMSLTGTNADEAATQLRGIMNALIKPSQQAEEALASVGLSSAGLRDQIGKEGLLPTLQKLVDALGNDSAATAQVFDDVRALTGVMNILGKNTAQTQQIFKDTAAASGDLDKAFSVTEQTTKFKLDKAVSQVKDSLLEIGGAIAPAVESVASGLASMAKGFEALPGPVQTTVVGVGALVAVAGPVAFAVGKVSSAISSLISIGSKIADKAISSALSTIGMDAETAAQQTGSLNRGLSGTQSAMAAAGVAVAGLAVAYGIWNAKMEDSKRLASEVVGGAGKKNLSGSYDELAASIGKINTQIGGLKKDINESVSPFDADYRASLSFLGSELEKTGTQAAKFIGQTDAISAATGVSKDEALKWVQAQAALGNTFDSGQAAVAAFTAAAKGAGDASTGTADKVTAARTSIDALSTSFFGILDATSAYDNALKGVSDAQRGQEEAQRRVVDSQRSYQDALDRVTSAEQSRTSALRRVKDAQQAVIDAQQDLNDALNGPSEDSQISLQRAELRLKQSKKTLATGKFKDPLDRESAKLDVRQAEADLNRLRQEQSGEIEKKQKALVSAQDALSSAQIDAANSAKEVAKAQLDVANAANGMRDAQREAADASAAVEKAQDGAARAAFDLDAKQQGVGGTFKANQQAIDPFIASLEALKQKYPELAASIQPYIDKVKILQGLSSGAGRQAPSEPATAPHEVNASDFARIALGKGGLSDDAAAQSILFAAKGATGQTAASLAEAEATLWSMYIAAGGRADGGPVLPGRAYRINERKSPEVLDFGGKQYLTMPHMGRAGFVTPLDKAGGRGDIHVTVNGYDLTKPRETAEEIRWRLRAAAVGSY